MGSCFLESLTKGRESGAWWFFVLPVPSQQSREESNRIVLLHLLHSLQLYFAYFFGKHPMHDKMTSVILQMGVLPKEVMGNFAKMIWETKGYLKTWNCFS